jgi:lipid-A-disaccharide synthase
MLIAAARYPQYQVVIAGAPGIDAEYYTMYLQNSPAKIIFGETYPLLQHSRFALVTSGTATLETALFRIPQIVCYYTPVGRLVSFVFRHFFHTRYISLVNLIADQDIVRELFGAKFSLTAIDQELNRLINDVDYRNKMLDGYDKIIHLLGEPGSSIRTASLIFHALKKKRP